MTLKRPQIRVFLTRERAVLMVCIGAALVFWIMNRLSTQFKRTTFVRLEYVVPSGRALSVAPPQTAQVTWQGSGWDLMTGRDPHIFLTAENDSLQSFSMRAVISAQLGIEVLGVAPEQITVELEESAARSVPIVVVSALSFAKGFDLADEIQLTPSVVTVEGPRSVVEQLNFIKTDTLKFDKLKDTLVTKARLVANPIFKFSRTEVEARLAVEQFTEKSLFVPIVVKNAPQSLQIFPNKIKLDCTVALGRYAQLSAANFVAEVDLKNVDLKSKNNTVAIILSKQPSFVRNLKFSPKAVEFFFEK